MAMTHVASSVNWLNALALALLVVLVATVATVLLGDPSAPLSFDLTTDPASGLWSW